MDVFQLVKDSFFKRLRSGGKMPCPCCDRYAQFYKRGLTSSMIAQLIKLYHLGGENRFVHTSELILRGVSGSGDFTKLEYWQFIFSKEQDKNDTKKKSSGLWKITQRGVDFIKGYSLVPQYFILYNNEIKEMSAEQVDVYQALGEKFDYGKLMAWRPDHNIKG